MNDWQIEHAYIRRKESMQRTAEALENKPKDYGDEVADAIDDLIDAKLTIQKGERRA